MYISGFDWTVEGLFFALLFLALSLTVYSMLMILMSSDQSKKYQNIFVFAHRAYVFFILSGFERIAPVFTFQFHEFSRFSSIFYTIVCSFREPIDCYQKIKKRQKWICRFLNRRSSFMKVAFEWK